MDRSGVSSDLAFLPFCLGRSARSSSVAQWPWRVLRAFEEAVVGQNSLQETVASDKEARKKCLQNPVAICALNNMMCILMLYVLSKLARGASCELRVRCIALGKVVRDHLYQDYTNAF